MDFTAENAEVAEKRENQISAIILDAAIAVHTALGPGLLRVRIKHVSLTNLTAEV